MPPKWFEHHRHPRPDPQGGATARMAEAIARLAEMRRRGIRTSEELGIRMSVRVRIGPGQSGSLRWRSTRRRPEADPEAGGVPVSPDRPRNLSGGAAAALEFEND